MIQRIRHCLYLKNGSVLSRFTSVLLALFFIGCSDNSIVKIYDKSILDEEITCMRLIVFPPKDMIDTTLQKSYRFDDNCTFKLEVFSKGNIHCNSNQNADSKALGAMPSSYLRMEISEDDKKIYSYYIDIKDEIKKSHVKDAFLRIEKDLVIVH